MTARLASFVLLAGSWLLAQTVLADTEKKPDVSSSSAPDDSVPEGYFPAIDLGITELEHGNYVEARARFMEAHRLYPNARTLRGLGVVAYEMRNYPASAEYFERALASDVRPLTEELRADTKRRLSLARGYLAEYTLRITPADATVELNGQAVQRDEGGKLVLQVGEHVLTVRKEGFVSARKTLTVASGEGETIELKLMPTSDKPDRREASRPLRKQWWVWTLAGVVAAGAATGLALSQRGTSPADEDGGSTSDTIFLSTGF